MTLSYLELRVPVATQQKRIRVVSMRMQVRSLASLSGSGIRHCHKLWCRSQTQLGSRVVVTVVQAASCSSYLTPSLGTSICHRYSPKKQKIKLNKINDFKVNDSVALSTFIVLCKHYLYLIL